MLAELRLAGLGVIDEATLPLHRGLNVVTGETGAGKTMVVSGLLLLFGARGDSTLVRAGAAAAQVEGLVEIDADHPAAQRVIDAGGTVSDGLVLARTVSAEGRSRAYVGGRSAPVGVLADVGEHLLAVHGQADQWRLRDPDQHRQVLDRFGGAAITEASTAYTQVWDRLQEVQQTLHRLRSQARDRVVELEGLQAGLEQIEQVAPQAGEDETLRIEDERLSHADELRQHIATAHTAMAGTDDDGPNDLSMLTLLARARGALDAVADLDSSAQDLAERLVEIAHLTVDLAADVSRYAADIELDPARLAFVQERRADLTALMRRYGPGLDDVLAWAEEAAQRHAELSSSDDRIAELEQEADEPAGPACRCRRSPDRRPHRGGRPPRERVTDELSRLAMGDAVVTVEVSPAPPTDRCRQRRDRSRRQPRRPGTLDHRAPPAVNSPVMLALEVALGAGEHGPEVPIFVFDEVDAGVGGRAARDVGARLAELARHTQVIVVTHLAQVAAYADHHLVVAKTTDGAVTASDVTVVEGTERVDEIARLLAGSVSATAREHARELLADSGS